MGLEGNSSIDIDWKRSEYSVTADGAEVARNGDTFCPVGNDRLAFYSKRGGRLSAPIPKGWDAKAGAGFELYADKAVETRVIFSGGKLTVEARPGRPILFFRDGAAARRRMLSAG
jgi:hypothetical protein